MLLQKQIVKYKLNVQHVQLVAILLLLGACYLVHRFNIKWNELLWYACGGRKLINQTKMYIVQLKMVNITKLHFIFRKTHWVCLFAYWKHLKAKNYVTLPVVNERMMNTLSVGSLKFPHSPYSIERIFVMWYVDSWTRIIIVSSHIYIGLSKWF